jgi:uncharacterized protein (DUF4415 family)
MGIVRYTLETLPPVSKKDWDRLDSVKDEDIDYSDIPEFKNFSGFRPWQERKMFKPIKQPITCKLDADIVTWLKQDGERGIRPGLCYSAAGYDSCPIKK